MVSYAAIGQSVARGEGADKVTGRSVYAADVSLPGDALGPGAAVALSPRPHRGHRC